MFRCAVAAAALLAATLATAGGIPTLVTRPAQGYALGQPRILLEQRLFGMAHAIGLLARTCERDPRHAVAARKAYADWHEQQFPIIDRVRGELSTYYFADQATLARWDDIVAALGLKRELSLKPGSKQFNEACASLPAALAEPRNDLAGQYRLQAALTRLTRATLTRARAETCLAHLGGEQLATLHMQFETWQHQHQAATQAARDELTRRWQSAGLDGSLDQLLAAAYKQGVANAGDCTAMTAWLASPDANPDTLFGTP